MKKTTGVLLLHGLTGKPSEMRPIQKYLEKCGFIVEAPLLAGHGGTHKELLDATWKDWVDQAEQDLNQLLTKVDQVIVCGLSMGSTIGTMLAARNPRVVGLIMLSPTFTYDGHVPKNRRHLELGFHRVLQRLVWHVPFLREKLYWTERAPYGLKDERLQRQITKAIEAAERGENTEFGLFRTYYGSLMEMFFLSDEMRKMASNVKLPVLIVSSLEDTLISLSNATEAYALLGTRNKYMCLISGCDHVLTLDLQRNYVCKLIGEFMETVTGNQSPPPAGAVNPGFGLELHSSLIGPESWDDLVPVLRENQIHERQCHTMVVRHANEALAVVPLFTDGSSTLGIGVEEKSWRNKLSPVSQLDDLAWYQIERVIESLSHAFKTQRIGFADRSKKTITGLRKPFNRDTGHYLFTALNRANVDVRAAPTVTNFSTTRKG